VLAGVGLVVLVPTGPDVLVVVSGAEVEDDPVIGGAPPVTTQEQAEEMSDGLLWHCDT
jgi:hypothetical protein